jgi:hypothetical protein
MATDLKKHSGCDLKAPRPVWPSAAPSDVYPQQLPGKILCSLGHLGSENFQAKVAARLTLKPPLLLTAIQAQLTLSPIRPPCQCCRFGRTRKYCNRRLERVSAKPRLFPPNMSRCPCNPLSKTRRQGLQGRNWWMHFQLQSTSEEEATFRNPTCSGMTSRL